MPATGRYAVLASRYFMILPVHSRQVQNDFLSMTGAICPSSPAEKPDPSVSRAIQHGLSTALKENAGRAWFSFPWGVP